MMNAILDEDPHGTATVIVVDWGDGKFVIFTIFLTKTDEQF